MVDWSERAPGISIGVRTVEGIAIVDVRGVLPQRDYSLVAEVRQLLAKGHRRILVNLQEVRSTGAYGVSNLVTSFVEITKTGGALKLVTNPYFDRILKSVGMQAVFSAYPTEEDALASPW